jgi:hypothetical protein
LFGQNKTEQYSGVLQLTGGIGGGASRPIDIWINRYNTDEDMKGYATLLVEGGPDKLRRALEKEDVGQIAPAGRIGIALAVARKFVDGNKTIIRLATARDMSFLELRYSGRSTDYPYTIVQLELDQNGKGIGSLIAAARVSFNKKKNTYEIESYQHGTTYNRIVNVRRMD